LQAIFLFSRVTFCGVAAQFIWSFKTNYENGKRNPHSGRHDGAVEYHPGNMGQPLVAPLGAFVGVNLIQSAFTGFCPAENIFRKLGIGQSDSACCMAKINVKP